MNDARCDRELACHQTLFVEGIQDTQDLIDEARLAECAAIRFGANGSFTPGTSTELELWENMIDGVLKESTLLVSLEFDSRYVEDVLEFRCVEDSRFVPIISVNIPYLRQFGVTARLRIDDNKQANPGVWTHYLHDLTGPRDLNTWAHLKGEDQ